MVDAVLIELALLFALCTGVAIGFHRLRLPPIVGFLVTGALVGPYAAGLVQHEELVHHLAEIGVVVLLFAVGMEVPLGQLAQLRRTVAIGGGLQILGTVLATALACAVAGLPWNQSLFLGFLLSMSSTAVVTKVLFDHGEFATPQGRLSIGLSIAQDLAVVPMILVIPLLGGTGDAGGGILRTLESFAWLIGLLIAARLLVPRVLRLVGRTRSRELFVLTLVTLCLSMAVATAHLGLSLAIGAFLAGVLVADTEFHGQAVAEVETFRDTLASLFFVSIGMLFDWRTIATAPGFVATALVAVLGGKTLVVALATRWLGQPFRVRLRAGLLLAQVGEFSFVLVQVGRGTGALSSAAEKIFLVVAVLSIASTPLLYAALRWLEQRAQPVDAPAKAFRSGIEDHAIVVGYGPTGRTVVAALRALDIPALAVELNADTVRRERLAGVPIALGDATRATTLHALGITTARILVLAINDTAAAARIAQQARQLSPNLHVLARGHYIADTDTLLRGGADEVVPQELEASIEILVRVLRRFLVPDDEIGRQIRGLREAAGGAGRSVRAAAPDVARIAEFVPGIGLSFWRVHRGSDAAGRSLADVALRRRTGCSVVVVRRGNANLPVVTPETVLEADDVIVVIGPEVRLPEVAATFLPATGTTDSGLRRAKEESTGKDAADVR